MNTKKLLFHKEAELVVFGTQNNTDEEKYVGAEKQHPRS
jgi:hypothetical protein